MVVLLDWSWNERPTLAGLCFGGRRWMVRKSVSNIWRFESTIPNLTVPVRGGDCSDLPGPRGETARWRFSKIPWVAQESFRTKYYSAPRELPRKSYKFSAFLERNSDDIRRPTGLAVVRSPIAPHSGASKQQACLLLREALASL